jgi:hypothetical protein
MRCTLLEAFAIASAHIAVLSAPSVALADDATGAAPASTVVAAPPGGKDILYLRSGGAFRGTIVEMTPGVSARIVLETGKEITVPRSETMRIEHLSEPLPVEPLAYGTPEGSPAGLAPGPPETVPARGSRAWYVVGAIGLTAGAVTAGFTLLLSAMGTAIPCELGTCATVSIDVAPALALVGGGTAVALGGWWLMDVSRPQAMPGKSAVSPAAALPVLSGTF